MKYITFDTFRKVFVTLSQFLGIIFLSYYIYFAKNYEISWNLLTYLMPATLLSKINNLLATTGTLILVIPLAIIILAIAMPESYGLRMLSAFFGLTTTLVVTTSGVFNDTLAQTHNMRIFLVTKILTLDEKRIIFKQEFSNIIEKHYKTALNFKDYVNEKLTENYYEFLDIKLAVLKDKITIKAYAADVVTELYQNWEHAQTVIVHQEKVVFWVELAKSIGYYGGLTLGVAIALCWMFDTSSLEKGFVFVSDGAKLSLRGTEILYQTQDLINKGLTEFKTTIPEMIYGSIKQVESMFNQNLSNSFEHVNNRIANLENTVTIISDHLSNKLPPYK